MPMNVKKRTATFSLGRIILALLLGAILWELVNVFYFWPQEAEALHLLKTMETIRRGGTALGEAAPPGARKEITFAEFKVFAKEHGLKWSAPPIEKPPYARFKVSNPWCTPTAWFQDGKLEQVTFGCRAI